jgi:hypothetical protein
MRRTATFLLVLLAVTTALAADDPPAPRPQRPTPVLAEGATPELEMTFTPAVFGYIPLDRADGDRPFQFHAYVYTPDHEGILGSHEVVLRPGQEKRFARKLPGDLRLRGTVTFTSEGILRYAAEVLVKDRVAARTSATLGPAWPVPPAAFRPAPVY